LTPVCIIFQPFIIIIFIIIILHEFLIIFKEKPATINILICQLSNSPSSSLANTILLLIDCDEDESSLTTQTKWLI